MKKILVIILCLMFALFSIVAIKATAQQADKPFGNESEWERRGAIQQPTELTQPAETETEKLLREVQEIINKTLEDAYQRAMNLGYNIWKVDGEVFDGEKYLREGMEWIKENIYKDLEEYTGLTKEEFLKMPEEYQKRIARSYAGLSSHWTRHSETTGFGWGIPEDISYWCPKAARGWHRNTAKKIVDEWRRAGSPTK